MIADALREDVYHVAQPTPYFPNRGKKRRLAQILAMQDALYCLVIDQNLEARERAQAACAWERIETQRRKLIGIPDPGSLRPESKPKRKAPSLARTLSEEVREQRSEVSPPASPKPSPSPTPSTSPSAEPEPHA